MNEHEWKHLKRRMRMPFEWLGIELGMLIFSRVSHRVLLKLADVVAAVGYRFDLRGRALAAANLRVIFGARLSAHRIDLITRRSYRNMARVMAHIFWTSRCAAERVQATGVFAPVVLDALQAHQPAITVSIHFGNWELLSQTVYVHGMPITSVAKHIGTDAITARLTRARASIGQEIVPTAGALKRLIGALRRKHHIGLLIDQYVSPKEGGVWVRFFGLPMCMSGAPALLSYKLKAPILLAWSRPLKDGRYRIESVGPLILPDAAGEDLQMRTQAVVAAFEPIIRRHPSLWVLNYRYWAYCPPDEAPENVEKYPAYVSPGYDPMYASMPRGGENNHGR